jgi:DNA repair photolyase
VLIIHEEAVNQFLGMAYFKGVHSGMEVSVKAMDYIIEYPYLVRMTLDVVGCARNCIFCFVINVNIERVFKRVVVKEVAVT